MRAFSKLVGKSKKSQANKEDLPRYSASSLQEDPSLKGDKLMDTANIFLEFTANIAEASDVLGPLKAACKATQTVIGIIQGVKNNREDWSEIIQRLQDYLSAIEEQITLLKGENTSGPLDEAFSRPLTRYVKHLEDLHKRIVDRTEQQRSKSLGRFAEISTIKIDAGDIQKFNRDIEAQHRQFMV
ncbi:SubName: Full=Related to archipelago beta form (F-box-WD40 repeat protein) {ECO:0000313/EMBL:CCA76170.1} [Serendipita indica DSM 11827]|nr:SubName: Full=Related to archipelago beta form (F-box-WD40 repeat protein) {ECO:0000313/EMBL:CCA76170.1} [Serendipita indica DSM 11827]